MVVGQIDLPLDAIADLCRKYHVKELAVFGSALRDDFRADSDIDVLVEYRPQAPIGLFEHWDLQEELTKILGRKVDLVSKGGLKQLIRRHIVGSSLVVYAA